MIRVLVPPGSLAVGREVELDESEGRHLDVRRLRDGDGAEALDGRGGVGTGILTRRGKGWQFATEIAFLEPEPSPTIIAVGAGDRDRFLWLAEKATELGATRVIPLETMTVRGVESRVRDGTVDKARRRAREACKQSGNAWIPLVDDVRSVEGFAASFPGVRWFLADKAGGACGPIGVQEPVGWLIGPESGFGLHDIEVIDNVLKPDRVALARHMLRFETAALAALAITEQQRLIALKRRTG